MRRDIEPGLDHAGGGVADAQIPYLDPLVDGELATVLAAPARLHDWVHALGSPLNVVLPDRVALNARRFAEVLAERRIDGEVYYAHKANRSTSFVRRLAATRARLDVASAAELQHAVGCGVAPDRVMVTGPKSPELLWLAASLGATVNVDSLAELELLAHLAPEAVRSAPLPVLLRFSGFETGGSVRSRVSRFGMHESDLAACMGLAARAGDRLTLRGAAYHLDTVGLPEKVAALDGCLRVVLALQALGHPADVVDVGGGFGVSYVADAAQWEHWTSEVARAVLGRRPPLAWRGHGYGLRNDAGRLRGSLSLYPAHRPVSGPAYAAELLAQTSPTLGQRFEQLLVETMTRLYLEPGRALLDQAGVVLCRVLEVRPAGDGPPLVRLDLNHSDVSLEEHGVVVDPVVVPPPGDGPREPGTGYLVGNLCLEADFVSRRTVHFRAMPRPGDLLAFPNTAGYVMDFSATQALQQHTARTIAVTDGGATWALDTESWPAPARTALPHPHAHTTTPTEAL